jgi:hypothetical protein
MQSVRPIVADSNCSAIGRTHALTLTSLSPLWPLGAAGIEPEELELAVGNLLRANFPFVRGPVKDDPRLFWESRPGSWAFRTRRQTHFQIKHNEQSVLNSLEFEAELPAASGEAD